MYQLYYLPSACSLATHVVLNELDVPVELIDVQTIENFKKMNPVGAVPVLIDKDKTLIEGAAILFYLLDKHENTMMPISGIKREQAVQDILFANATMHPAYGRLFFIAQQIQDNTEKHSALNAAAKAINSLWQVVETRLVNDDFLGGQKPSAADIMLAVYYRWSASFPVDITLGVNTEKMIEAVLARPSFERALSAEMRSTDV